MLKAKQYYSIIFLLLHYALFSEIINPPKNPILFTPENTVFMFDVDGVLVERGFWQNRYDYWAIFKDANNKFQFLQMIGWNLLHLSTFIDNLKNQENDAFIDQLAQEWPVLQQETPKGIIAERIKETMSKGVPKQEIITIVLNLHKQGFPITIATNQGRKIFDRLVKNQTLPDFSLYSLIFTPDYNRHRYLLKPDRAYFRQFKKELAKNNVHPKHLIFIDDTYENVVGAAKEHILSIFFKKTAKNSAQLLQQDLEKLGIRTTPLEKEKGREKFPASVN